MKWLLITSILSIPFALAQEGTPCPKSPNDPFPDVSKFVCETRPAVLRALNPDLNIPPCVKNTTPTVPPAHLPVSGIFVTCNPAILNSCKAIASSLLQKQSSATVNVIVNQNDLPALGKTLEELLSVSRTSSAPLNIIPIRNPVPTYLRDPGLFRNSGQARFVSNPYLLQQYLGSEAMSEVMEKCNLGFETSYRQLSSFQSTLQALKDDPDKAIETIFGKSYIPTFKETAKTPDGRERIAILAHWDPETQGTPLMGGNFIALPGGTLAVGESPAGSARAPANPAVLAHYSTNQNVVNISIPKLWVGHIDEVFNIVPAKNPCGFAILRASPTETRRFLATRPQNEVIGRVSDPLSTVSSVMKKQKDMEQFAKRFSSINRQLREERQNGVEPNPDLIKELKLANDGMMRIRGENRTVSDVLGDQSLQRSWDDAEKIISDGTATLLDELRRTNPTCKPEIIDLPVLWSANGEPALANPVNGLSVNGSYFHSQAHRDISSETPTWKPES